MSNYVLISNLGTRILRWIFFAIDTAVYALAKAVYMIFANVAGVRLVDPQMAQEITQKIYTILGIAMIFVIAWNLLNYIIDPDRITDKKMGATTLIKDVLICLVLTSAMPTIFNKLYALQNHILTSNVISNFIFDVESNSDMYEDYYKNRQDKETMGNYQLRIGANTMVANIFSAFFRPENDEFSFMYCDGITVGGDATDDDILDADIKYDKKYCDAYADVKRTGNIQEFRHIYTNENYRYDVVISTAAGVILLFFMLSFCINLAKRVGKMAILQLLAPIPLALEILPNKKGSRERWLSTLLTVYLEVFIFQAVVYLVIYLITLLPNTLTVLFDKGGGIGNGFVRSITFIILCFGLFQFGKEAPKMIMDILGVKESGTISEAFKRAGAMGGVAANTIGSTIGNMSRGVAENKGWKKVGGALGGGASAFARNLWAGRNAHNWKDARANRLAINQGISDRRLQRQADQMLYDGWKGALKHNLRDRYYGLTSKLSSASGFDLTPNHYLKNQKTLDAYTQYKALHKEISDIWSGNAEYQMLDNEYKKAVAIGDKNLINKYKVARDDCKTKLIQKNSDKIVDVTRKINNFAATHQNIPGFEGIHISEDSVSNDAKNGNLNSQLDNLHKTIFGQDKGKQMVPVLDSNGKPKTETVFVEQDVAMVPLIVDGKVQKRDVYDIQKVKVGEEPVMMQAVDEVTGEPKMRDVYETKKVKVGQKEVEDYARYPDGKIITKRVKQGKKWVDVGQKVKRTVDIYENQEVKVGEEPVMIQVVDENTGNPIMRDVYEDKKVIVGHEDVYIPLEEATSKYGYKPTNNDDIVYQKKQIAVEKEVMEEKSIHENGAYDNLTNDPVFRSQRNDMKNNQEKAQALKKAQAEKNEKN